ncbi:hypothetical protein FOA43_001479 [Brettanomyces nanus]|uniref:Mediator of RNA polymerase II transcription subunit 18 n=1 Tax=Eeniella nana TaxID=13502 RepID=A0A875S1E0_EENNA|nr:uncharacterized protein FOA43_001479 [Brettanomyces nanus]QPG74155.1 hypothetical protein FOA43_001479 [Brettanomyces nanus]
MVQQLSLTSSVPENQFRTVRITLRALTGLRPEPLARHTIILKPKFPFTPEQSAGKVSQVDSYRIRMVRVWEMESTSDHMDVSDDQFLLGESISDRSSESTRNESIWTMQLSDIPAGGNRPVSIQNIYEATVYKTDDIIGYMDEFGYMPEIEFWTKGYRYYYNDIIIEVFRLYVRSKDGSSDRKPVSDDDTTEKKEELDELNNNDDADAGKDEMMDVDKPQHLIKIALLDKSCRYQVKCFVNVSKLNDLDSVAKGVKELEMLKKELGGMIDLHVPDRTYMDSRLNSRIASKR